ncbi:MAG: hypothetical protein A3F43_01235 [Gammaproteobacteria bacterium RIFCSPHIGHO2_12_FULL_42_10]|nr:MAG: hypothetical protein A3F43_01235 [Gammaproteobacteria bacterium RIFCSPHIGHO2_12_FULL_42_10]
MIECDSQQFYLAIPEVAHFLALPTQNQILIEKINPDIPDDVIHTWLYGTVFAYILQYHGYTVLHGSAILMDNRAVIFSGQSGAGKSTLASAFMQKGYPFITDDLIVIKRNEQAQYCIIPGPTKLKLWQDSMKHFNHDINKATPISLKDGKYALQVMNASTELMIPIAAFYELNNNKQTKVHHCETLNSAESLKTLMQNAYRYFMLKPLGKLQTFFHDCHGLSQQIAVHKLTRTIQIHELTQITQRIELDQGVNV